MDSKRWEEDLQLALVMADQVDALTMSRFRADDLEVNDKPDLTPVTDADRSAEHMIRTQLSHSRSRDAVVGEEEGSSGYASRRWVIDPIDGTSNFLRGVPVWATLIGLMEEGRMVVGVASAPALGCRWWAAAGSGAWTGRSRSSARQIHVSKIRTLEQASFSYSEIGEWAEAKRLRGFMNLSQQVWRTRAYGDFWSYMLVAEGVVDIASEPELNLWDMGALYPIVTEAGGHFTGLDGTDGVKGPGAVVTNGRLHSQVLDLIGSPTD
ncbi:MAG: inositol monophosphatase family protein [Mobiluncus porci]|uniref:Histidinol-phosphatase n=1 Tax=Mobiluncus porci TaxID=2652278 RepID=A0A7K0K397_9ACTO|nr:MULTISPECIES: inositol monophosphatase family protein [Mobiluncus]MCI6583754.1 histidinol phosphatase [Mobiluncus sp.]MDD7541991.1 histidinol phosphatase [Mobiluncus porci]MDY5747613.1 inositol monophosphatase family protein [Mobiluncus porci]MST49899.1 histidinol phosphatase [Mobiluncus porci]